MEKTVTLSLDFSLSIIWFSFCVSDLTGAQDGSVRMFEWTRPQQLVCFRQAGNARVTRLYFNSQGNKVSSWRLLLNSSENNYGYL